MPSMTRSPLGVGTLVRAGLTGLLFAVYSGMAASGVIVDLQFDGDFTDDAGGSTVDVHPACPADPCNSSAAFGSDVSGTFWQWTSSEPRGGGFTLNTLDELGETFTIKLAFSFDEVSGFNKIIDFKSRASDNGLYLFGGYIRLYPLQQSVRQFAAGEKIELVIARNGSDDELLAYVVDESGRETILDLTDTNQLSVAAAEAGQSILGFFHDDLVTTGESSSGGKVYSLQILDTFEPRIFRSRFEG